MTPHLPPTLWALSAAPAEHPSDLWAVGADLAPGTILHAYTLGLFPMPLGDDSIGSDALGGGSIGWLSPAVRARFPLDERLPRTVRRARARFEVRVDTAFGDVIAGCADPRRPGGWIDARIVLAYAELHKLGWVHSVEAWDEDGLAGGLYGVAIGGLFAAESMFQRRPDASKAALAGLVDLLRAAGNAGARVLDGQWLTPHLSLLGARPISRIDYAAALDVACALTDPFAPRGG